MAATSGPWRVRPGDTIRRPRLIEADGFVIGEAHWNEHMDGEAEDNATLMAAAPELLAALRAAVANHCPLSSFFCSTCTPARELIKRIEGR